MEEDEYQKNKEGLCWAVLKDGKICNRKAVMIKGRYSLWCDQHQGGCRNDYNAYKNSCKSRNSWKCWKYDDEDNKVTPVVTTSKQTKSNSDNLNQCINERKKFEKVCIHPTKQDWEHDVYINLLKLYANDCDSLYKDLFEQENLQEKLKQERKELKREKKNLSKIEENILEIREKEEKNVEPTEVLIPRSEGIEKIKSTQRESKKMIKAEKEKELEELLKKIETKTTVISGLSTESETIRKKKKKKKKSNPIDWDDVIYKKIKEFEKKYKDEPEKIAKLEEEAEVFDKLFDLYIFGDKYIKYMGKLGRINYHLAEKQEEIIDSVYYLFKYYYIIDEYKTAEEFMEKYIKKQDALTKHRNEVRNAFLQYFKSNPQE